jgi:hypothetical protein
MTGYSIMMVFPSVSPPGARHYAAGSEPVNCRNDELNFHACSSGEAIPTQPPAPKSEQHTNCRCVRAGGSQDRGMPPR